MKQSSKRKVLVKKKTFFISIIGFIILILIVNHGIENCNTKINYALDENKSLLKHNYITFLDENSKSQVKLIETNGWLLLEAVLENELVNNVGSYFSDVVESFGVDELFGWWPKELMQNGKQYFLNKKPLKLYYDSDDTAWVYRYYGDIINENILKAFISNEPLQEPFYKTCIDIGCEQRYVLRVWSDVDWHDDVDIVTIANFITMLDTNSNLSKKVFETNKQLINFIIENREIDDYFKYFEPKSTGYFLLLFYDYQGPKFLTDKARNILFQKLKVSFYELSHEPIHTILEKNTNWYGCTIVWSNEHIPKLMQKYAAQHWDI